MTLNSSPVSRTNPDDRSSGFFAFGCFQSVFPSAIGEKALTGAFGCKICQKGDKKEKTYVKKALTIAPILAMIMRVQYAIGEKECPKRRYMRQKMLVMRNLRRKKPIAEPNGGQRNKNAVQDRKR